MISDCQLHLNKDNNPTCDRLGRIDFYLDLSTISVPHIGQAPAFGQSQSDRDVFRLRLAALGFEGALIMMPMTW